MIMRLWSDYIMVVMWWYVMLIYTFWWYGGGLIWWPHVDLVMWGFDGVIRWWCDDDIDVMLVVWYDMMIRGCDDEMKMIIWKCHDYIMVWWWPGDVMTWWWDYKDDMLRLYVGDDLMMMTMIWCWCNESTTAAFSSDDTMVIGIWYDIRLCWWAHDDDDDVMTTQWK